MLMRKFRLLAMLALAVLLTACSREATSEDLANTSWVLEAYGTPGAEIDVIENTLVTMEFDDQGNAGGSGGCNSYGSTYTVEEGMLVFAPVASTLIACVDNGVAEQEGAFFAALETAGAFELDDDHLRIFYDNGQNVLIFAKAADEGG